LLSVAERVTVIRMSAKIIASLMFASLQFASLVRGEDASLVDLVGGNVFDLGTQCDALEVLVPVTPKGNIADLSANPEVVSVRFGNQSDETLRKAFEANWETPADVHAIKIIVKDYAAIARSGTYDLTLGLKPSQGNAGRQLLKLQIIHPAAKLRPPDTLVVERTLRVPGGEPYVTKIPLTLTEVSKRSCLTDLRIQPVHNAAIGDSQVTGHLKFLFGDQGGVLGNKAPQAKLAAGDHVGVDYQPEGDFPLGTVKGALEVTAVELSDALLLNFEVRSRLSRAYILLFIIAGLFVSYFLKVKLQHDIALGEARLQADKTLKLAEDEAARRLDSDFRTAIVDKVAALRTAIQGNDAPAIAKANDELDTALRSALQNLSTRKAELQKQVDEFLIVTNNAWEVPLSVQQGALLKAKNKMTDVVRLLANDNIGGAQESFNLFKGDLVSDLKEAIRQWQENIRSYLEALKAIKKGISAPVKDAFAKMVDQEVTPVIVPPTLNTTAPAAAEVVQALRDAVIARRHVIDVLRKLDQAIETNAADAKKIVSDSRLAGDVPAKLTAAISKLEESVANFVSTVDSIAGDPEGAAAKLDSQLADMNDAWQQLVLGQVPPGSQPAVKATLDQQLYVEAVRQAVNTLVAPEAITPPSGTLGAAPPTSLQWRPSAGLDISPSVAVFQTIVADVSVPSGLTAVRVADERQLRWAKFTQSLLIGVLLTIIGCGLYWEKFVGNFSDFLQIFFWAFGLDITVDTVLKSAPKKT
jgi:hypothetical protein